MGRKFVIAMLSVMTVFTAFVSSIFMMIGSNDFPVDCYAYVYEIIGNNKILIS